MSQCSFPNISTFKDKKQIYIFKIKYLFCSFYSIKQINVYLKFNFLKFSVLGLFAHFQWFLPPESGSISLRSHIMRIQIHVPGLYTIKNSNLP